MKILLALSLLLLSLYADSVDMLDFEAELFSKESRFMKKVSVSLHLEGNGLQAKTYALEDGLNILLSSYYLEDLLTSKGKEGFKKSFIQFMKKRYKVPINDLYILKMVQIHTITDIDELIEALKKQGCCSNQKSIKKLFNRVEGQ